MSDLDRIRPDEVIAKVQAVSSFLATTASSLGFHDALGDLGKDGGEGLCYILRWMEDQLATAGVALDDERNQREIDALRGLGAPQHTWTDKRLRRAWADGYAHAMAQLDRLDPATVAAFRQQFAAVKGDAAEGPEGG